MRRVVLAGCVLALALSATAALAEVKPHGLIGDHMVLQQNAKVNIFGTADPGEKVTVTFRGQTVTAVADKAGSWLVALGPFKAGGPFEMTIAGSNTIKLSDVLVGEVWVCSGQSNMWWPLRFADNAQAEIEAARYPNIRLFTVPSRCALPAIDSVPGEWTACTPQTVPNFSAVAYFFGRELHKAREVPVGLIHSSWGGTAAEAWTNLEALQTIAGFKPIVEALEKAIENARNFDQVMATWWRKNDPGSAKGLGWADPTLDDSGWKTTKLPAVWEKGGLPDFDGVVWFRKEVQLPKEWAGKDLKVSLGPIDDIDTTLVNGVQVGETRVWNVPREYRIAAKLWQPGRNVIAVRVLDTGGAGGIYGRPEEMTIAPAGDAKTPPISLAGNWKYRESTPLAKAQPLPAQIGGLHPHIPSVLYNGMIHALTRYRIAGAIWYQGESNAGGHKRAADYETLFPTMIKGWRAQWGYDFPFLFVQLANFFPRQPTPINPPWARLREAQLKTLELPKTGMAVTIDIGQANDIHPRNKQDVGRRLALAARGIAHAEKDLVYSGPIYKSMKVGDGKVRLTFDHVGGGLKANGEKLTGFAIAGADRKFVWANAEIDENTVVVSSEKVAKPVAVRYAWANNPECNLVNKEGLPASPFRTDDW